MQIAKKIGRTIFKQIENINKRINITKSNTTEILEPEYNNYNEKFIIEFQ